MATNTFSAWNIMKSKAHQPANWNWRWKCRRRGREPAAWIQIQIHLVHPTDLIDRVATDSGVFSAWVPAAFSACGLNTNTNTFSAWVPAAFSACGLNTNTNTFSAWNIMKSKAHQPANWNWRWKCRWRVRESAAGNHGWTLTLSSCATCALSG